MENKYKIQLFTILLNTIKVQWKNEIRALDTMFLSDTLETDDKIGPRRAGP